MCWIAFKRRKDFKNYFSVASSRWLDWIGIIKNTKERLVIRRAFAKNLSYFNYSGNSNEDERQDFMFANEQKTATLYRNKQDFYSDILSCLTSANYNGNPFYLLHHRKTTSGESGLPLTHPFETNNYIVLQNGSAKEFEQWGKIEYPHDGTKSDTWFLAQFIDRCKDFDEIAQKLEDLHFSIGVVAVVDKRTKTIMLYSDGSRSFFFEFTDDTKTKIKYASSLTEAWDDKFSFTWHIVFDWWGNVLENATLTLNLEKAKPTHNCQTQIGTIYQKNHPNFLNNKNYVWSDDEWMWCFLSYDEKDLNFTNDSRYEFVSWRWQCKVKNNSPNLDTDNDISDFVYIWYEAMKDEVMEDNTIPLLERVNCVEYIKVLEELELEFLAEKDEDNLKKICEKTMEMMSLISEITNKFDEDLYYNFDFIWEHL
jgi:hypothetical protein